MGLCIVCLYSKFEVASYKSIHKTLRAVVLPLQEPGVPLPQPLCPDPELCTLQALGTTRSQGVFCLLMLVGRKETVEENGCLFIFRQVFSASLWGGMLVPIGDKPSSIADR